MYQIPWILPPLFLSLFSVAESCSAYQVTTRQPSDNHGPGLYCKNVTHNPKRAPRPARVSEIHSGKECKSYPEGIDLAKVGDWFRGPNNLCSWCCCDIDEQGVTFINTEVGCFPSTECTTTSSTTTTKSTVKVEKFANLELRYCRLKSMSEKNRHKRSVTRTTSKQEVGSCNDGIRDVPLGEMGMFNSSDQCEECCCGKDYTYGIGFIKCFKITCAENPKCKYTPDGISCCGLENCTTPPPRGTTNKTTTEKNFVPPNQHRRGEEGEEKTPKGKGNHGNIKMLIKEGGDAKREDEEVKPTKNEEMDNSAKFSSSSNQERDSSVVQNTSEDGIILRLWNAFRKNLAEQEKKRTSR